MTKRTLFVFILFVLAFVTLPVPAHASVTGCSVNVSPHTTTRDTSTVYSFEGTVDTESGEGIMWVRFTRPSSNFTITNGVASGWSSSTDGNIITFTAPAQTYFGTFQVYATSGSSDAGNADWSMQMSHDGSGASAATCSGDLWVSISGSSSVTPTPTPTSTPTPDTTAPSISNVTISGVSDSSLTIAWQTNESANSNINYGTTTSYTSSKGDSSSSTAHSLTLTGLSSNTTYHGQIQSTDSSGNTANSSDFTFATSQTTTTVTVTTTVTTTTVITPTPTPTPIPDRVLPKVSVTTDLTKLLLKAPKIEGTSTDNAGVAMIEYSVDDGLHWAKVDQVSTLGEKKVTFSFTPLTQGDGNYLLKVRATDTSDNKAETSSQMFIIDRLPPAIGGALFSIGPQILQPSPDSSVTILAGLVPKLTFAAVGGPTSINLKINGQIIPLSQNAQTRLWSGNVNIEQSGVYTVETEAIDGAQNHNTKFLSPIIVEPNGTISDFLGPVSGAEVKVFYFDAQAQEFRMWGASQYGQKNPQFTDELGRYKLLLPAGTYFLQIESSRSRPVRTSIFTLEQSTPIAQHITMTRKTFFQAGVLNIPLPDFGQNDVMMNLAENQSEVQEISPLVGKPFPDFNLNGVTNLSLNGKPMLVTILTTWLPQSSVQMSMLQEVVGQGKAQSLVIMSQESIASVNVFAKRGGYSVPVAADPDGMLNTSLQLTTLPTHYFLDRKGIVKKVMSGVLNTDQIEAEFTEIQ